MNRTIPAIETRYNGINFRSRLEAKWAAMFDLLRWGWTYEPTDFNGWIPDFAIHGKEIVYVEVKPVSEFPKEVAQKIDRSGCSDEVLIVGMLGPMWGDEFDYPIVGWLREPTVPYDSRRTKLGPDDFWWDTAPMSRYKNEGPNGRIGFCHSGASFTDRISGGYDGGSFGSFPVTQEEITMLWREASNRTRWNPKQ